MSQTQTSVTQSATPFFTNDQIAYQLTNGYWGGSARSFNVPIGGSISVNMSGLTTAGQSLAQNALSLWTDVTGLNFVFTLGSAQITFDDNDTWSAYNWSSVTGGTINYSYINVGTGWIDYYGTALNSYSFQTYIHEIGHALGLGHAGNYNGSAQYGSSNHYSNDSWQASVMSYFSQSENQSVHASAAYAVTPQVADVLAIRYLYGTTASTRTSNTTYGDSGNAGDLMQQISVLSGVTYTIVDDGGIDTLDFSGNSFNQTIDLNPEAISDVRGFTGNLLISRGTNIENAEGGGGADTLIGNSLGNELIGNAANDVLNGLSGDDFLSGGSGDDLIFGSDGNDNLDGGLNADQLIGGQGNDIVYGGSGSDLITGDEGDDNLSGNAGDDLIFGDNFGVTAGNDAISGGAGSDTLLGFGGNDVIYGGTEGDNIDGGAGNDIIQGEAGNDLMTGSTGSDAFQFLDNGFGADTITDFEVGSDFLQFSVAVFADFAALQAASVAFDAGTAVFGSTPGDIINLQNVAFGSLSESDVMFV